MRIGVLIEIFRDTDIDAKFAELRSMGMESCQLVCWDKEIMNQETADKINVAVGRRKVDITAFWCGWDGPKVWDFYDGQLTLGLVPEAFRYERVKMLQKGIAFADMIHVKDVATHVGYMPENPYDPNYAGVLACLKELVKLCKENGQNFLFETGQETPVTLKRAIQDIEKDLGRGNVGINLDPANLIMYGKANPVDALEVFGEYVMGIHGKDGKYPTDGHMLGDEVPLGKGKVNYPAFVAKLKEIGYTGDITIEREISGEEQKKDIIMAKEVLDELLF
ncbi:MAG: sugar phosphate isomerase/epimerase [Dorea sp.]|nr:sugar phosphate isomerase/epimerase [Dorea sp.]